MKPREIIKQLDLEDEIEVAIYTGSSGRTVLRLFNENPQKFHALVTSASAFKKALKLDAHELERRTIEVKTRDFLESGGQVEIVESVYNPDNVEPKARAWGSELDEG